MAHYTLTVNTISLVPLGVTTLKETYETFGDVEDRIMELARTFRRADKFNTDFEEKLRRQLKHSVKTNRLLRIYVHTSERLERVLFGIEYTKDAFGAQEIEQLRFDI